VISLAKKLKHLSAKYLLLRRLRRENAVALAQTALTALLWGTSFPVIGYAIRLGLDPRVFVFLRFGVAAPIMAAAALAMGKGLGGVLRMKPVWVLGLLNAVGFVCQFVGQAYTDASVAALLVNLSILVAAAGSAVFLGERFGGAKVAGVLLALAGTVLLTTKGDISLVGRGQLFGDALYLLAALTWGCYIVYNKRVTDETGWDPFAVTAAIIMLTVVFVAPILLTGGLDFGLTALSWEAVLYTAVMNTALPYVLYQSGLRHLTATSSAIVLMLEIVTAVLISVAFLGETMNAFSAAGAVLVLVSIFLVSGLELGGKSLSVATGSGDAERLP
jgi:DME family drug/metabolite transporter